MRQKPSDPCAHLLVPVPDTVLWDPDTLGELITPPVKRGRPALCTPFLRVQVYRWLVATKGSFTVVIPDVLLAQLVWGARTASTPWPRRWRQKLRAIPFLKGKWTDEGAECPKRCPIRDCGVPHGHFQLALNPNQKIIGRVQHLAGKQDTGTNPPETTLDFTKAKKVEGLRAVYLPALLFAASPNSKIAPRQGLLLSRLVDQLTRTRAQVLARPDKAQVFTATGGALAADNPYEYQLADCPFLTKGRRYAAFNGNRTERMKNKPHGYGLKVGTRAEGAGYPTVAAYLKDLGELVPMFDLVVGGYDPAARRWYTLDQLKALGDAGRSLLLRVYGPADYHQQWRATFYDWLGFDPLHVAVQVASAADVRRVRTRARTKKDGLQGAGTEPVATSTTPPRRVALPDLDQVRTDFTGFLGALHWRTEGKPSAERPAIYAEMLRQAELPAIVKYVAAVKLVPGQEAEFLGAARAEYAEHPATWDEYLRGQVRSDSPDDPVRRAVAQLTTRVA